MKKSNLPVILLRGIILLPYNDIRLEFDNDISKSIIEKSEQFFDNQALVVCSDDPLEVIPNLKNLPKIGVVATLSHKVELPNGKVRIIVTGKRRVNVHDYISDENNREPLEAIISDIPREVIDENQEIALSKKIYRELDLYIKSVPYMSNSILSLIINETDLSKVTDIVAFNIPSSVKRQVNYLLELKETIRAEMILEDIYKEKEMFDIERTIDLKVRQDLDTNQREFLIKEKIKKLKEELGEKSTREDEIELLNEKISSLNAPVHVKNRLNDELKKYEALSSMSPEMSVIRTYIDWLLDLPWQTFTKDNDDLKDVGRKLNKSHYGLDKVKLRIIEYLAVKQKTNSLRGPIICLVGPPGVGKTTLAFSIANAMNRNFVKISVGGVNDEAEIMGHRRTYLGANPGRIIQSLKKAKSSNPVFLIDEIDKMTKDFKGDPASALLEVLDIEQNKMFSDNYIEEEVDLSDIMFITTANYVENIPEPLKDRLEIINLSGYTEIEKLDIAKKHLIPKILREHGMKDEVIFSTNTLLKIIRNYTKEAGVRQLERQLSTIIRKIVTSMIVNNITIDKLNINPHSISKYLGKEMYHYNYVDKDFQIGVVTGLAYTGYGGDVLPIEVNYYRGKGDLVLTGSLGDIMKESARIALSYIKANYCYFDLDYSILEENDIHIHVPEGAIPKDGPSAGIALTSALISAIGDIEINQKIAMTGEITLRGNILPIGGLKEKSIGANRNGIKKIIIPYDNLKDLDDIPNEIKEQIEYIPVKNYKEVLKYLVKN